MDCEICKQPNCDYHINVDKQIRTTLWQGEGVLMSCQEHIIRFRNDPTVIKIEKTILDVTCGFKECNHKSSFEVYCKRPNDVAQAEYERPLLTEVKQ